MFLCVSGATARAADDRRSQIPSQREIFISRSIFTDFQEKNKSNRRAALKGEEMDDTIWNDVKCGKNYDRSLHISVAQDEEEGQEATWTESDG